MKNRDVVWKLLVITLATAVLFIVIGLFYKQVGDQVFIFTIIPVAITALFFGLWPGIIMETVVLFLGFFLLSIITGRSLYESLVGLPGKNVIGILSHYGLVALLGYMYDQHKTIKKLHNEILRISKIDVLTNLYNRRALLEAGEQEFTQTIRNLSDVSAFCPIENKDKPSPFDSERETNFKKNRKLDDYIGVFSCAMLDIDFFKKVNDTYGHLMGDVVLQKLGKILSMEGNLRKNDIYGRYGGEEFLILFPNTSVRNSIYAVERITEKIKLEKFVTIEGDRFSITISTGISQFKKGDKDINDIIHRADKALYYAKHHGRDRIVVFEDQFEKSEE